MVFTKKQIAEISGLSPRLIQFYTEESLIKPEKNSGEGRGNVRLFSEKSLFDFLIIAELGNYGIKKFRIAKFLKYAQNESVVISYYAGRLFEKDIRLFGFILNIANTKKLVATCKMIAGGGQKMDILTFDEMEKFSSLLVVDIGALIKKALTS